MAVHKLWALVCSAVFSIVHQGHANSRLLWKNPPPPPMAYIEKEHHWLHVSQEHPVWPQFVLVAEHSCHNMVGRGWNLRAEHARLGWQPDGGMSYESAADSEEMALRRVVDLMLRCRIPPLSRNKCNVTKIHSMNLIQMWGHSTEGNYSFQSTHFHCGRSLVMRTGCQIHQGDQTLWGEKQKLAIFE